MFSQVQQPADKPPVYADLDHPNGNSRPAAPPSCDADKVIYAYVKTMTGKEPQVSIAYVSYDAPLGFACIYTANRCLYRYVCCAKVVSLFLRKWKM